MSYLFSTTISCFIGHNLDLTSIYLTNSVGLSPLLIEPSCPHIYFISKLIFPRIDDQIFVNEDWPKSIIKNNIVNNNNDKKSHT